MEEMMEIKVGDFVRWKGEKLENECLVDGITMRARKLPFTDGKPRKVLSVCQFGGDSIRLRLEGIGNCVLVYPISMIEVVPQVPQEPAEPELPEYGEKVLVWDNNSESPTEAIYVAYVKNAMSPVVTVYPRDKTSFENGDKFRTSYWKHFKRITKPQYRPLTAQEWVNVMVSETPVICNDGGDSFIGKIESVSKDSIRHTTGHLTCNIKLNSTVTCLTWQDGMPCGVEI